MTPLELFPSDWRVVVGDCREVLAAMPSNSVDACVTDPPYELGFMGKKWDASGVAFDPRTWAEVLRVLKPGAHLVAFGGTRTYHRMVCAIEDAGFEIRDSIHWLYGSGMPKSLDVGKALDKAAGAAREVVGSRKLTGSAAMSCKDKGGTYSAGISSAGFEKVVEVTAPATDAAKQWNGWGTGLKPGHEPIVLARKPLVGTVAANVLQCGVGALNIDACRVATDWNEPDRPESWKRSGYTSDPRTEKIAAPPGVGIECHPAGRWPANVVFSHSAGCRRLGEKRVRGTPHVSGDKTYSDKGVVSFKRERSPTCYTDESGTESVADYDCADDCPVRALEEQSGSVGANSRASGPTLVGESRSVARGKFSGYDSAVFHGDTGTAARFFSCFEHREDPGVWPPFLYRAKASTSERERGLGSKKGERQNRHPTVKPTELMRWLVRLVTPKGGLVLDPFTGSGSTGCAAVREGFRFLGVELDEAYAELARRRIAA